MKAKTEGLLDPDFLQQYAIADREADFEKALQNGGGKVPSSGLLSVKSSRSKMEKHEKQKNHKSVEKRGKDNHSAKSNKKRKTLLWVGQKPRCVACSSVVLPQVEYGLSIWEFYRHLFVWVKHMRCKNFVTVAAGTPPPLAIFIFFFIHLGIFRLLCYRGVHL